MPSLLICDDAPDAIAAMLSGQGGQTIDIQVAREGREALEKSRAGRPDLILLDVAVPGLEGFSVCAHLKAHPLTREIPVIFLTGSNALADKLRGFAVGGVDYITKPFHPAEVLARVQVHLHARQQMRQVMRIANLRAVNFDPADDPLEKKFQRALILLEESLTSPLGLAELARKVGIDERKLTELFRQRVGVTVFDYVSERRLECSCHLLDGSSLQVRQIADQLGYKNPGDLTRAFRRHFGITPREYRRAGGAEDPAAES